MTVTALAHRIANPYGVEEEIAAALTDVELLELVVRLERASVSRRDLMLSGDAPRGSSWARESEAIAIATALTWYLRKRLAGR